MIACIGGAAFDRRGTLLVPLVAGASNYAEFREDFGGVARNVAQNLARLGCGVGLVSRVGDDESGRRLLGHAAASGVDISLATVSGTRTASYTAILDMGGELVLGLDDFAICEEITPAVLKPALPRLREYTFWFLDANLPGPTIDWLLDEAQGIPAAVDAISPARAERLVPLLPRIDYLFCNAAQAAVTGPPAAGVVSNGADGITVHWGGALHKLPALPARVRDVTGAGDALISGTLYGLSQGLNLTEAARMGLAAAAITVESEFASAPELSIAALRGAGVPVTRPSEEVREALAAGRPVVALESTIVTHGMPYPENVETARSLEQEIRSRGAVPATIAVIGGTIRIGLSDGELEWLGSARDILKLSRNDLPYALAAGKHGATTVAATMICAHRAGIRVFATGGIGGVHRGAATSFDISADLEELARTRVAVVCAGAKALLDLPKTLEYLETRGVPIVGYRTDEFPAFWSRSSGLRVPVRLDSAEEIARMLAFVEDGAVICNPVDAADEIPAAEISGLIDAAVAEAALRGVAGKAVTPYILSRMVEVTGGRSLRTNIALVKSNARLAAGIAAAMRDGPPGAASEIYVA